MMTLLVDTALDLLEAVDARADRKEQ